MRLCVVLCLLFLTGCAGGAGSIDLQRSASYQQDLQTIMPAAQGLAAHVQAAHAAGVSDAVTALEIALAIQALLPQLLLPASRPSQ